MILGGGSNCQGCGCGGTCPACTRTCQNPHSGAAFQEVYRGYSFGAINGLASDGYLTFSGDEDNPAFISRGGPFHQEIGGTFYLDSSVNRFPCSLTVSFWRTLYPANAATDTELSSNTVTITCVTGQFMTANSVVLNPGETYTFSGAVPLVSFFPGDPHGSTGTFGGYALCDNTMVAIRARIDWGSSERIHVLHGIVRECYEEGSPCATFCSGSPSPNTIYLTISNVTLSGGASISGLAGTYVMSRVNWACDWYQFVNNAVSGLQEYFTCTPGLIGGGSRTGLKRNVTVGSASTAVRVSFSWVDSSNVPICGSGVIKTGTGMALVVTLDDSNFTTPFSADGINPMTATCNWKVEA